MEKRITSVQWSATGLPAGLSFNTATGTFSGTPESAGEYNVPVTVRTNYGANSKNLKISVAEGIKVYSDTTRIVAYDEYGWITTDLASRIMFTNKSNYASFEYKASENKFYSTNVTTEGRLKSNIQNMGAENGRMLSTSVKSSLDDINYGVISNGHIFKAGYVVDDNEYKTAWKNKGSTIHPLDDAIWELPLNYVLLAIMDTKYNYVYRDKDYVLSVPLIKLSANQGSEVSLLSQDDNNEELVEWIEFEQNDTQYADKTKYPYVAILSFIKVTCPDFLRYGAATYLPILTVLDRRLYPSS